MSRIVIALGGNALGYTPDKQKKEVSHAAHVLVNLIKDGHEVIITHGNGPQVGMIHLAFETSSKIEQKVPSMELPECSAMSQGYIAYHLENALRNELKKEKIPKNVVSVITETVVDKKDPAFSNPTKPIGGFYDEATAKALMKNNPEIVYKEDSGRGWRKMVPSPKPIDIVDSNSLIFLLKSGFIVIACGGGGIPVIVDENGNYKGVSAVLDKDLSTAKLAEMVEADILLILTAVEKVALNWGKPNQTDLSNLTVQDALNYCKEGHFAPGSMLPKIEAAIQFVQSGENRKTIISSLENALEALKGRTGTLISN